MYWKGIRSSIRSIPKSCKSCQVNEKRRLQANTFRLRPLETITWRVLCVDLIGPYTLKGKDGTVIDFMALTMIDLASSWFEIVELSLVSQLKIILVNIKESSIIEEIFKKSSDCSA
jgi:hypothetical protein